MQRGETRAEKGSSEREGRNLYTENAEKEAGLKRTEKFLNDHFEKSLEYE